MLGSAKEQQIASLDNRIISKVSTPPASHMQPLPQSILVWKMMNMTKLYKMYTRIITISL